MHAAGHAGDLTLGGIARRPSHEEAERGARLAWREGGEVGARRMQDGLGARAPARDEGDHAANEDTRQHDEPSHGLSRDWHEHTPEARSRAEATWAASPIRRSCPR